MGAEKCGWKMICACLTGSPGKSAAQDPQEDPGQPREAAHKEAKQTPNSGDLTANAMNWMILIHPQTGFYQETATAIAGNGMRNIP